VPAGGEGAAAVSQGAEVEAALQLAELVVVCLARPERSVADAALDYLINLNTVSQCVGVTASRAAIHATSHSRECWSEHRKLQHESHTSCVTVIAWHQWAYACHAYCQSPPGGCCQAGTTAAGCRVRNMSAPAHTAGEPGCQVRLDAGTWGAITS
jgi:hypothetical protein